MSGWSTDWLLVQPEVAEVTRACAYDRAGYGWSDEGPRPQDNQQVATALNRLLAEAGIEGEIILVGHSLGGVFAHTRRNPEQVVGLVLVDSVHPRQSQIMPEAVRDKYEGNLERLTAFTRVFAPTGLLRLAGQTVSPIADKLPDEYQDMVRALGYQSKAYRALDAEMAAFRQSQAQVQESGAAAGNISCWRPSARRGRELSAGVLRRHGQTYLGRDAGRSERLRHPAAGRGNPQRALRPRR